MRPVYSRADVLSSPVHATHSIARLLQGGFPNLKNPKMDAQVNDLLISRCVRGMPPVTAREILGLLGRPMTAKSELNKNLYKTERALVPEDNLLGLPEHYRLVRIQTRTPRWRVVPNCSDAILEDNAAVDAWHVYAMLRANPNTPVDVTELRNCRPRPPTREQLVEKMTAHMLTAHERVELAGDSAIILRIADPADDDTVELDCDKLVDKTRTHGQCVILGMAIMECVVANRTKKVVLVTSDPGTRSILRHVLKTNEYARALNVTITPD